MRIRCTTTLIIALAAVFLFTADAQALRDHSTRSGKADTSKDKDAKGDKSKEKPFATLIKDKVAIEGLFTFYHDTVDNSMLMSIKPEQFGPVFLCGESRSRAEGRFYDNSSMQGTYPFYFKRVGKRILMMEKNLRVRADTTNCVYEAVQSGISDHLRAATDIKSAPDKETEAILVDPTALFVKDAGNTGYFLGQRGKTGIKFDSKNSYFEKVISFPENTEVSVRLHFKTSNPQSGTTMQNPYSFFHTYHYSLSTLPETDYIPRFGDDRIGHFMTYYQDYSQFDTETPYVHYIRRWNLKKKNPDARISEPIEPIVFWVDRATPEEYRDAIAEGIEFWSPAFEKIGFRNAIVAKQMPEDADWDPADVRYSTVQWMVQPGRTYAVGPSRANPFTGQIYDADIRISADFIRAIFSSVDRWIKPLLYDGTAIDGSDPFEIKQFIEPGSLEQNPYACNYQAESSLNAAFGLAYLSSVGDFADKDSLTREYVHAYIVELVAHEVGHTLGFRHNFKASTIYSLEQLSDREFTREHSTVGTIMDYTPVNISPNGLPQGEFYASVPGPYDDWMIEYAYSDLGATTPEEELPMLEQIALHAPDSLLVYATDEDAFGTSMKSIDPLVHLHDLGDDPLRYADQQVSLSKELWYDAIKEFEKPGTRYQKIYRVFQIGWRGFYSAARIAPKYVGGIYHRRSRIGDPGGQVPFEVVPAIKQRKAVEFLKDNLFAADAFDIPAELLNKLQSEDLWDFNGRVFSRAQIDYPLHQTVLAMQNRALSNLYSHYVLGRLLNNIERVPDNEEKYTMFDMFTQVRRAIWDEIVGPDNINSFRRQLQLNHLNRIINIYLGRSATYPSDARTLAANDLNILESAANKAVGTAGIDGMTKAHFAEVLRQIEAAKNAERQYLR